MKASRAASIKLVDRAKAMLFRPGATWKVIEGEFTKPAALYTGYILPLAAVGAVCSFIGTVIFGARVPFTGGLTTRVSLSTALTQAIGGYALALVSVFIVAQLINLLAPTFGGLKNDVQALKVAAYASTAHWVGGVFALIPALALVNLLASLYSLYLLYTGLPVVMKTPDDQAMAYAVVVIVGVIVIFLLTGAILTAL